ncbi:PRK06851 family protein [Anaerobacillus sp. MEB173]|uniref:PRK06851 family protein n=1 Tax=Anaerobacillus sp. MEB173 TaxID=3383345 RepID=UPI003F8E1053
MNQTKYYYAGGNTSIGYYSLFNEIVKDLSHVYILKGGPGTGKSTFIKKIGEVLADKGYSLEYFSNPTDPKSYDGVIIPKLNIGVFSGSAPQNLEPAYPGVIGKVIDLQQYCNGEKLNIHHDEIIKYTNEMQEQVELAYKKFADGVSVHNKKEEIYLSSMDFKKADAVTEKLIKTIFESGFSKGEQQKSRYLFFGAATPEGALNYIENITSDVAKRYIIKGRSGSGKSTVMRKIGAEAQRLGYSVDYFQCGLDPTSLDMVIIQPLNVAVLDGTAPHVIDPSRETDEVVDMFELCMNPQVEVDYANKLEELTKTYKGIMKEGTWHLQVANRLLHVLEEYYRKAMDFEQVDKKREEIVKEILSLA